MSEGMERRQALLGEQRERIAALEAESAQLKKDNQDWSKAHAEQSRTHLMVRNQLEIENAKLRAEVERLTNTNEATAVDLFAAEITTLRHERDAAREKLKTAEGALEGIRNGRLLNRGGLLTCHNCRGRGTQEAGVLHTPECPTNVADLALAEIREEERL